MAEKPPEPEDEKEAERRFNETLGNMLRAPHKPHAPLGKEKADDPVPRGAKRRGES